MSIDDETPPSARLVYMLLDPSTRHEALQRISSLDSLASGVALHLWNAFGVVASLVMVSTVVYPCHSAVQHRVRLNSSGTVDHNNFLYRVL